MSYGFVSSKDARGDLNLGALVAGKVKNALAMSAEERKAREAEIKALTEKEERTAEETERLEFLQGQDTERKQPGLKGIKNSFFAKAMATEFGGDRRRRLMGTFSKSPDATKDPSLTKEQRFSALLNARPAETPVAPAGDDLGPMDYGDGNAQAPTPQQGSLDKLIDIIKSQYSTIGGKLSSLGAEEKKGTATQEANNSNLSRITGVLESIKNYFNKDNDLKEQENTLERDKVDIELDAEQDAKASRKESNLEQGKVEESTLDSDTLEEQKEREGKDGGGLLGGLLKGAQGLFKLFGGKKPGGAPGVKPSTQYTKPIGPQPMNSPSPWAAKGDGDRGGLFGQGGFTPRMPSAPTTPTKLSEGGTIPMPKGGVPKVTKLAAGGIVDNPTRVNLPPGSGVIPLNRNNALGKMFKSAGQGSPGGNKMAQPMAEVMQLPSKVGGGLLLSLLNRVMSKLGGIARFVKPVLKKIATPIAAMFGLPATIIGGLFGAPAAAATLDSGGVEGGDGYLEKLTALFKNTGSGGLNNNNTPPGGAAADLAGTGVVSEVTGQQMLLSAGQAGAHPDIGVTSGFGNRDSPGGVGSTNHQGVDIGVSGKKDYKVAFQRSGTVTHSGTAGGFGNLVIIKDSLGTEYYFAHLASINPEMTVGAAYTGQTIGVVGNTGTGTGEHLHFEKHPNAGAAVDPIADIGLISIGKQTTTAPGLTAPVLAKNRPTPQQVAQSTQLKPGQAGPVIPVPATPPPKAKTPPPASGPSQLPVKDPSGAGDSFLSWF